MRTAQEATLLEAGGAISVRRSSIKTSSKTFRMQIDSIYSDKIGAPVRELAANAFDSHKRANQERPFFVHCPSMLDPRFWVRDFGVGMTDDTMGDVYIVLGESDKEETDDEVGMWGLGSKSPFAYADQYTITCFDGQTARHYGYGIAEDGVPNLYLMHQEESTEPCGVQVGFAVESRDFEAFKRAIEKVAIAHNGGFESNIALPTLGEVAFQGNGWTAYEDDGRKLGTASRWYARQGCVLYPITAPEVKRPSEFQNKLTYILDCPIGTIRITPSRESIEYKPQVIDYLNQRVEAVEAETIVAIEEATKDIASVAEFFRTIEKIKPNYITHGFAHPLTGLTEAAIQAKFPLALFEPKFEHGRWEFGTPTSLNLKDEKRTAPLFILDTVAPLYDPSRGEHTGPLTRSEIRRISRFTRAYLESQDITAALFVFGADWSPEFRDACFGQKDVRDLAFADLKKAVPTRVAPPKAEMKPPIRGLALAKAAGEQKPVFEIEPDQPGVAWVSSEQYRRQAANLFKLAKRFGIAQLYISAPPAQGEMTQRGIKHLRAVIDEGITAHGLTFSDLFYAKEKLTHYDVKSYVEFLTALEREAPGAYTKLAAGKGEFSTIARFVRRLLPAISTLAISEDEKKALDCLTLDDDGHSAKPEPPEGSNDFTTAIATISRGYNNPTCQWVKSVHSLRTADMLTKAAGAILYMQKLFPPSAKF